MNKELLKEILNERILLICPKDFKEKIISFLNKERKIADINFLTLDEYRKNILFDYDTDAILHLMKRHQLSSGNAEEILENLYVVDEDKHYGVDKLDKLVSYKKELLDNGLLISNPLFENLLKERKICVAGYGELSRNDKKLFLGKEVEYHVDEEIEKVYDLHSFEDIEDEVEFVYDAIYELLKKGIDINKIHIMNVTKEYDSYFKRFNTYYPFEIMIKSENPLIGTAMGKQFMEKLNSGLGFQEIYDWLIEIESPLSGSFISLLNRYAGYEIQDVKEIMTADLSKIAASNESYRDVVEICSFGAEIAEEDYVFLMGFNDKTPHTKQDNEYLTDNVREYVDLPRIEEENELIKKNARAYLSHIDNLVVSVSRQNPFNRYNDQILFDKKHVKIISDRNLNTYSEKVNRMKYGKMLDKLLKYGYKEDDIDDMYINYGHNDFLSYVNVFGGIRDDQLMPNPKTSLSYTSMNAYYECAFKYFLQYRLGLNDGGNFNTKAGDLCHRVLKDCFEYKDFDFEESWQRNHEEINRNLDEEAFRDEKELFFVNRMKDELKEDIQIIRRQKEASLLDKELCERKFDIDVTDRISFKGFIDKLMYREDNGIIDTAIVDYKTGSSTRIEADIMEYGLSLQLPCYLYLLSKDEKFSKNTNIIGFYLQHIINNKNSYDEKDDLKELKRSTMKLDGISSDDVDRLSLLDTNILNGVCENIDKIRIKKDGSLSANSRVISDEGMESLVKLVEEKIIEAGTNINQGNFAINPKKIDGKNRSCTYCPFSAICYKTSNDLKYITTKKEEEF